MLKFIRKCLLLGVLVLTLCTGIGLFVTDAIPLQFKDTYQYALNMQYRALQRTPSPKVVVMGDSSVPFSLNAKGLRKALGRPVRTLGIQSSTGLEYIMRLSESNIQKGDIMVVELYPFNNDEFSAPVVLVACENTFSMYRYFSLDNWSRVIPSYPSYLVHKVKFWLGVRYDLAPSFTEKAFDQDGNYDFYRGKSWTADDRHGNPWPTHFSPDDYNKSSIDFLNKYNDFCKKRGATFLISFPPYYDQSMVSSKKDAETLQKYLAMKLNAPIITKITDRELTGKYILDGLHCNSAGADKVTKDLAGEILHWMGRIPRK